MATAQKKPPRASQGGVLRRRRRAARRVGPPAGREGFRYKWTSQRSSRQHFNEFDSAPGDTRPAAAAAAQARENARASTAHHTPAGGSRVGAGDDRGRSPSTWCLFLHVLAPLAATRGLSRLTSGYGSGYVSPARAFDFGLGIGTTRGTRMATFTCSMHDGAAVGMACHARVATGRIRPLSLARAQHMHTACACSAATSKSVTEMWRARGIPRLVHGKKPGHIRTGTAPDRTPRRVPERALCPGGGWIDQPQQVFCSCGGAGGRR